MGPYVRREPTRPFWRYLTRKNGYSVSDIFIKHDSRADITVSGNAYARIDCFDNSEVKASALGLSRATVNVYGDSKVTVIGNVKVNRKGRAGYAE